jgi:hypothetical protein
MHTLLRAVSIHKEHNLEVVSKIKPRRAHTFVHHERHASCSPSTIRNACIHTTARLITQTDASNCLYQPPQTLRVHKPTPACYPTKPLPMRTVPDKPLTKAQTDTEQVVHAAAEDETTVRRHQHRSTVSNAARIRRAHSTPTTTRRLTRMTTACHRRPHPLPQIVRFVLVLLHPSIIVHRCHHHQSLRTDG